jgi:D-glycero-D-manno-heptose 1,7-bisphosphate phosphatase
MRRAVFLDRDGVVNAAIVRDGLPYSPRSLEEFTLLPDVPEACARLRAANFDLIVATNQPEVARGHVPLALIEEMHRRMCELLPISRVEVCYDAGGDDSSEFRKPMPGMLLRASRELGINLSASYMVGDRWRDIDCGNAAGCTTIFIDYGYSENLKTQPHFRAANLFDASGIILSHKGDINQ